MDKKSYIEDYNDKFFDSEKGDYRYRHPHAAVTTDCVIFGFDRKELKILLIERGLEPHKGMWALPGGFMKIASNSDDSFDVSIEATAKRELKEETNLSNIYLHQFRVYSRFDRDPRERVITVAFIALVDPDNYKKTVNDTIAGDDASNAFWWNLDTLPPLAFDHAEIIKDAKEELSRLIRVQPVMFNLLGSTFSMTELQTLYEKISGHVFDRRNFQRKALQSGMVEEVADWDSDSNNDSIIVEPEPQEILLSRAGVPTPKRRKKLFTFRNRKDNYNDEDAGIKDIFNW